MKRYTEIKKEIITSGKIYVENKLSEHPEGEWVKYDDVREVKKDKEIKELKEVLSRIHKKNKLDKKYLRFTIADVLRSINDYKINEAKRILKEFGGVQQYHNYPASLKPERPEKIWFRWQIY